MFLLSLLKLQPNAGSLQQCSQNSTLLIGLLQPSPATLAQPGVFKYQQIEHISVLSEYGVMIDVAAVGKPLR